MPIVATGAVVVGGAIMRTAIRHATKTLSIFESNRAQRLESDRRLIDAPTNVGILTYNKGTLSSNINSMYSQGTKVPALTPGAAALDTNNVLRGTTISNKSK